MPEDGQNVESPLLERLGHSLHMTGLARDHVGPEHGEPDPGPVRPVRFVRFDVRFDVVEDAVRVRVENPFLGHGSRRSRRNVFSELPRQEEEDEIAEVLRASFLVVAVDGGVEVEPGFRELFLERRSTHGVDRRAGRDALVQSGAKRFQRVGLVDVGHHELGRPQRREVDEGGRGREEMDSDPVAKARILFVEGADHGRSRLGVGVAQDQGHVGLTRERHWGRSRDPHDGESGRHPDRGPPRHPVETPHGEAGPSAT